MNNKKKEKQQNSNNEIDDLDRRFEKSMKSWNKLDKRYDPKKVEKTVAQRYKKFLKKLKVSKNATIDEIKSSILNYANTTNENVWELHLSNELRNDKDFMLQLFKARPEYTTKYGLTEKEEQDLDFLVKYSKLKYDFLTNKDSMFVEEYALEEVISSQYKNIEFLLRLSKEIPNENFIDAIFFNFNACLKIHKLKFEEFVVQLPLEFLCEQAQKFGADVLLSIPKNYKGYNKVLASAVECDGFNTLQHLKVGEILANKDLVIRAGELFGKEKLEKYIAETISPEKYRQEHAIHVEHERIMKYYGQVQKALYRDPKIQELLTDKTDDKNSENDKNL